MLVQTNFRHFENASTLVQFLCYDKNKKWEWMALPKKINFTQQQLEHALNKIKFTDREREVINLYYFRGWYIEDVAAELDDGVSRSTINRILSSIRKKIQVY